jgi:cell wall-associated NlpC family hydrolase/SH3-like domain-containing protein
MQKRDINKILGKIRQKKSGKDPMRYFSLVGGVVILVLLAVIAVKVAGGSRLRFGGGSSAGGGSPEKIALTDAPTLSPEAAAESESAEAEEEKEAVVDSYKNLGIVNVSGFLNLREKPDKTSKIVGKLYGDSACEILDDQSNQGWYKVTSGGLNGYISSEFVLTGDEAKKKAMEACQKMAVINTEKLNVRTEPSGDAQIVEQVLKNERYTIKGEKDGWIEIPDGYISADFVDVKYALNEARELDLRTAVLNMYDNLGISDVDTYLNIRSFPGEDQPIIGKFPGKAAGELIEMTTDHQWYKIQSGPVTGYVKAEYILTGDAANQFALENAKLMAIVNTDRLNVRKEPNTDSQIWTQISNSERYDVVSQDVDGWVQIQLDDDTAYVMTDYVDVRYALNEAIQYTPPAPEPEPETQAPAASGNGGNSSSGKSSTGKSSSGKNGSGKSSSGKSSSKNGSAPSGGSGGGKRSSVVSYAVQFLGNPYVWGGTSLTNGTDCSGFTMSVMSHFGVSLPHHAASQAGCGSSVSAGSMKPGDLVFYSNGSGINHVAIYIGNGQVVHASNPKSGIKISSWNYRTPAAIRNVLGN